MICQLGYEKRAFWTRSDKTHVAAQDVQDLCQFVDAKLSDDCAHPRYAGIAFGRPARTAVGLGVGPHAAEFEDREDAAMQSYPVLAVEDRTGLSNLIKQAVKTSNGSVRISKLKLTAISKDRFKNSSTGPHRKPSE